MTLDLPLLWTLIIAFGLMMYVITDGFDLGIGILFPFVRRRGDRDLMVNSVAPIWDGNETWLVLGGAGLFAAFPLAYAVILSALYIPFILMLVGLIWRGVSFEFRIKADDAHRPFWDRAFAAGSYTAAFTQGVALGAFISGFRVENGVHAGGPLDWLTPFNLFVGLGVVIAYALLGVTWLVLKTEGDLQARMRDLGRPVTGAVFLAIIAVSLWTPLEHPDVAARWFSTPNLFYFAPVPVLVVLATWLLLRALSGQRQAAPFGLALLLLFLGYSGLAISLWPNIIPPDVSIWEAAGPESSMGFTLVGALIVIPIILAYSGWSYYVFRGKVKPEEGY
ncbi:cytochrome d ubiquinol oxidase subunit II [Pontibaca methylaminivorans]|uniref:Cytochrome bd-I ubiquinol oxidase subunit 2 apoprotein n=1 Tax=Pontibaca methylaminivorans TaxID=515897 RepID=A0A1R3WCJ9_9RHOB|nr:cytochrome d ubiquinol oxidase subunit II [Pontibaca methylaminivorans]SIT75795.1 cytochrome bd-I ubiquinol oxidase subunit 2 apoprotein [Pontibaca methylaminivorans]